MRVTGASERAVLTRDGAPIGTVVSYGLSGGSAPPGAPLIQGSGNFAITGGTGAFLGARGQYGQVVTPQTVAARPTSVTEDPANRRRNRGGLTRFVIQLFPMIQPQIMMDSGTPAIYHADFSPVAPAKPAKAGEVLIVKATGLGPTVPGVDPGQPFSADAHLAQRSLLRAAGEQEDIRLFFARVGTIALRILCSKLMIHQKGVRYASMTREQVTYANHCRADVFQAGPRVQ